MSIQALNQSKSTLRQSQSSQAITTEEIVLEIQNSYQVDMERLLKSLAQVKYGLNSQRQLTVREKEIFCLSCNSIYSALEKSFIREYRRRITLEEINAYIEILNHPDINLNNRSSATKYRNSLPEEIAQASSEAIKNELNIKLRIATVSVKVFDDRTSWSKLKNELIHPVLNLDQDTQITPSMIMTMFRYKYPLT